MSKENEDLGMYDIILFDLDGTLTDPKEGITRSVQYGLKYLGIEETNLDNLIKFIGPPLTDSFKEFYGLDEEKTQMAILKYRERYEDVGIFENGLYDGIEDILKSLKETSKKIALATSKPEVFAKRILEKYNVAQYFDEVVGSTLDGGLGTKEMVIREVFNRLNLKEKELKNVIMVGDRKHDIIGAKACNIKSIGVKFGYAEENELKEAGADYIVDTVQELKVFLLEN